MRIVRGGIVDREMLDLILLNVRTPQEREGDLASQIGACRVGEQRILQLAEKYGEQKLQPLVDELLDYSERLVRAELRTMPAGDFSAEDWLDDDGVTDVPRRIAVRLRFDPEAASLTHRLRRLLRSGCRQRKRRPRHHALGVLLHAALPAQGRRSRDRRHSASAHARHSAPAASSMRCRPLRSPAATWKPRSALSTCCSVRSPRQFPRAVPAASAGTMSNLTIGGVDPRTGEPFTYYETTAGGMGARPGIDGISGVQTHMTNSLNTPIEALEYAYPLRVRRYAYRDGSGGAGQFRGGDGLIREVEMLADAQVTLLADRRKFRPYGLQSGEDGAPGRAWVLKAGTTEETEIPGKCTQRLSKGDILHIETPGGGGWGKR